MKLFLTILSILVLNVSKGQNTLGVTINNFSEADGYYLLAPFFGTTTYLVDFQGRIINQWESDYRVGTTAILAKDGYLYRAGSITNNSVGGPGGGGVLEKYDWAGNLVWQYQHSDDQIHQHHDFRILDNGNILVTAWEAHSPEEAMAMGRNPEELIDLGSLWSEQIIELEPIGSNDANIVWEWHVWDHLIQDFDENLLNYGIISESPRKININYRNPAALSSNWLHINGLDYNSQLDQIALSVLQFNEVWIINHALTSAEAETDDGDLLFRWGNPSTYDQGTEEDRTLFGQHNFRWVESGLPDEGSLTVFNNGSNRPDPKFSSVELITPSILEHGTYEISNGQFVVNTQTIYQTNPPESFYSRFMSSAELLQNGNLLINYASFGTYREIDASENVVWEYINPVTERGVLSQGESTIPPEGHEGDNFVFKAEKYGFDYPAFQDKTLIARETIEANGIRILSLNSKLTLVEVFPNPSSKEIVINHQKLGAQRISLKDLNGKLIYESISSGTTSIQTSSFENGLYFLKIANETHKVMINH